MYYLYIKMNYESWEGYESLKRTTSSKRFTESPQSQCLYRFARFGISQFIPYHSPPGYKTMIENRNDRRKLSTVASCQPSAMQRKRLLMSLLVGTMLLASGAMSATATSSDPATPGNENAQAGHDIHLSDGTVRIQQTHLRGPGLPTTTIEHRAFTIDSSTITIDGFTLTIDGHTQTVGHATVTIDDVGIVLEDVSTGPTG
jgi:hypothetical protein